MAEILEFRTAMSFQRATSGNGAAEGCEVIIFPGVRYERWDDAATEALDAELAAIEAADRRDFNPTTKTPRARKATKKQRDILVLPD